MVDQQTEAALAALVAAARRSAVGRRLQGDIETRLLQSIVDATVRLFDAEAASIALFEQDPDRLEFRVAAGEQGAGAVGLTVPPSQGIAGFVYSTGQALALSDVANDPRFNRDAAEQTGYVPRSIAAAPLLDEEGTVGVLQVLDKRGSPTFSLQDMELLAVFAGQATVAIAAARVQRDTERLLRSVLGQVGPDMADAEVEDLVTAATADLDVDDDAPFWRLVDQVARLRSLTDRETALLTDILDVVATHAGRGRRPRAGR
ncbi:MAG: GAF domain-containing protein [Candidatus Limnocylindria bacterium]